MDSATRQIVTDRAANRCEYCHIHQDQEPFYRFHIEHIVARQHGGPTELTNLALACHHCNLNKGPNLTAIDPETGLIVQLFHPQKDLWAEHFEILATAIRGLTPTGRATVRLLKMNSADRLELRRQLFNQ